MMRNLLFVTILVNVLIISLGQRSPNGKNICPEAYKRYTDALLQNSVGFLKSYAGLNPGETGAVSAYAIETIAAALANFTEGEPQKEIYSILDVKSENEIVCIADITNYPVYNLPDCIELELAICVFGGDDYQFTSSFTDFLTNVSYKDAVVENLNFAKAEEAADTINTRVANLTNNRIPNIINDSSIFNTSTQLVSVNGWSFESDWEIEFQSVKDIEFKISATESGRQEFLCQNAVYLNGHSEILGADVVQVNFCCGSNFYLWVIVPDCLFTVDALIDKMNQNIDWYYEVKQVMNRTELDLCIVKYDKRTPVDVKNLLTNSSNKTVIYNDEKLNLKGAIECDKPAALSLSIQEIYVSLSTKGGPVPKKPLSNGPKKTFISNSPHVSMILREDEVYFIGIIREPIS